MGHTLDVVQATLRSVSVPVANTLGIPRLPEHAPTVVLSFGACVAVQLLVAPPLLALIGKERYTRASAVARNQWCGSYVLYSECVTLGLSVGTRNVRVVAFLHALVIIPLAFRILDRPELNVDRVYGWHPWSGTLSAVACGCVSSPYIMSTIC